MAERGDPKLHDAARRFVVQQLAMYDPPSVVAKAVKEEFDLKITPQAVQAYDPTKWAGRKLAKRWVVLFETTRKAHEEGRLAIGISHKNVRLARIQRMADKAEASGNMALAAQLLEQAAREEGDAYSNRRKVDHNGAVVVKGLSDFYGSSDT